MREMLRQSQVVKILHSLSFQLPAVVMGVFLGILFLLMLFFHEMSGILVKTRQLAQSAEINDNVSNWLISLSSSARIRTKLMSLGEVNDLKNFLFSLHDANKYYEQIENINPDPNAASTQQLIELHNKNIEYLQLAQSFSVDRKDLKSEEAKPLLVPALKHKVNRSKIKDFIKPNTNSIHKHIKSKFHTSEIPKAIELDTATNETFKAYELTIKEGLVECQELMRYERTDKLMSLRNSVGRAKDRLIYSLLLLLAMVGYVAIVLKWKILDPMKVLKSGVLEIGKGNLGFQVAIKTRNEIGELADVFNQMSEQLNEKRNAENRLKRLEAIEQIVRSVNHEINNPLMIISGNAEYLLAVYDQADESTKAKLNTIVSEVRRIFIVTQRLKEIKEPITENYIGTQDQMIDLLRSSQIRERKVE